MKEKKNIDRLFQERFKDFEATPSDAVWKNIESQLNQKKNKRRVIPIWWRYAGVAALLLLFLTIGDLYFNSNNTSTVPTNQVVDTKKEVVEPSKSNSTNDFDKPNQATDANNDDSSSLESNKSNQTPQNTVIESPESVIANNPSKTKATLSNSKKGKTLEVIQNPLGINDAIATTLSEEKEKTESTVNQFNNELDKTQEKNTVLNTKQTTIANVDNEAIDSVTTITDSKHKTLTIEDAIAETKTIEKEKIQDKWSIAPNAAPVYFNSLGKGSSIDSQFNSNSKSGEVNMSYGVTASYAVTKNLKVRSGINKVNLGYNTNDVVVFETVGISSSSLLKNVNASDASENISIVSGESLRTNSNNESFIKTSNTSINQSLGYIEIPLEIEYAVINKKLGVNVIGGFSSFFLNSNKLYSEFGSQRTLIGEATNLNKVSYSANFGLGLNYKMTKKFELNLEPMFKYQINTFNNTSGNFKPYFIGVYTGIGFKF